jgi:replicative DNA helicase
MGMIRNETLEQQTLSYIYNIGVIPENLREIDFTSQINISIFTIFNLLKEKQIVFESEFITSHFPEEERDKVKQYLIILKEQIKVPENIIDIIKTLNLLTERRGIQTSLQQTISDVVDPTKSNDYIRLELDKRISDIPRANSDIQIVSYNEYLEWRRQNIKERREQSYQFVGTGLYEIDVTLSDGFAPGIISLIVGESSHGKSTVADSMAEYIGSREDRDTEVMVFKPESGIVQFSDRMDTKLTGISIKDIKNISSWEKNDPRIKQLKKAAETQSKWRIHRFDMRGLSAGSLIQICREYKKKYPKLGIIFIDTVQDLSDTKEWGKGDNQNTSIEKMLYKFEVASKELELHICLLSQQPKPDKDEKKVRRAGKYRPDADNIRGSGMYIAKATWAIFVYRPFIYEGGDEDNEIQLWIVKDRDGARMLCHRYQFIGNLYTIGDYLGHG